MATRHQALALACVLSVTFPGAALAKPFTVEPVAAEIDTANIRGLRRSSP